MTELISFSRPEGLGGTLVLDAEGSRRRWSMVHETFTLTLVTGGAGKWRCRGETGSLHPGQVLLIEPGDVHSTLAVDEPGAFSALFLPPDLVRRYVAPGAAAETLHFKTIAADDGETVAAMRRLRAALARRRPDPLLLSQLAAQGLRAVFERHGSAVARPAALSPVTIQRAAELIREAFERDPVNPGLTVECLASTLEVEATSLVRGFGKATGLPPYQYLLRLRVERARRMIQEGPRDGGLANLTDVSLACGFYDLSHMGRVFRKVIGMSPSRYAAQIGAFERWRERGRS